MAYTTINKSSDFFNTKLYSGTGSSQSITGVGHQPDFVWIKQRSGTQFHQLANVIQGVGKQICSNATEAESTDANGLTAFGTDGFSVGSSGNYNNNGGTFASWNWKAGGGQGSSNTDGSINTTYTSVNTTAGFSISKYTGNGSNPSTVGHGLGVAPKMIIIKNLDQGTDWQVYHASTGNTKGLLLNLTASAFTTSFWGNTTPTNSVFTLGVGDVNTNNINYIAYCFAEKTGYSKFGSYVGNGDADGTFVFCGFKPAFVMYKKAIETSGNTARWTIIDNKRDIDNVASHGLFPNANSVENTGSGYWDIDMLSNGFKMRTTEQETNESGSTFVFMAFAEAPLVGSNNVPCTAR